MDERELPVERARKAGQADLVDAHLASRRAQERMVRIVALVAVLLALSLAWWIGDPARLAAGFSASAGGA